MLAGITHKMSVSGFSQYFLTRFFVISSILSGYPWTGFLVIPGRSINVKSGTCGEYTTDIIGLSLIHLF